MKSLFRGLFLALLALFLVDSAYAYYCPRLGRWISRDPIKEDGGINLYAYCGNDPVNRHDPLGFDWKDGPLDGQWVPLGNPTFDQASKTWNVMMRYVIPITWGGRLNVYSDSMMPLAQAKRLAPHPSYWQMPLVKPTPTLLGGTDFQGVDWAYLGYYMDHHPGFNAQMGIYQGALMAVPTGYGFGLLRGLIGAEATGYVGSGLLGMGLGEWAKNGFAVTPQGLGQVIGGGSAGGLFVESGEAFATRMLADAFAPKKLTLGGMWRNPRLSEAGSVINPFAELFGEGPEVDAIHLTTPYRGGFARPPRHHIFPQAEQEWFAARGVNIDDYTVQLAEALHQALHGGGNWKLGQLSADEWNAHLMGFLRSAESAKGSRLNATEILFLSRDVIKYYGLEGLPVAPFR
jgi:hypothetical protein